MVPDAQVGLKQAQCLPEDSYERCRVDYADLRIMPTSTLAQSAAGFGSTAQ